MSVEWPWALLGLLVLVPLGAWMIRHRRRTPQAPDRLASVPLILALLGLATLLVAVARPVASISLPRVEGTVIVAFDNSNSMLATDAEPSRIAAAQAFARQLVERQPSTVRVGVVSFSSGGVILQPATTRHELVLATIDRLAPDGGTSLAQGLFTSLSGVVGEPIEITDEAVNAGDITLLDIGWHGGSAVVVVTDGENRAGFDPRDVAQLASNAGVQIIPVGVGEREGTVLEVDGWTVATALNDSILRDVADITNGTYHHLGADADVDAIAAEVEEAVELELTLRGEESEITGLVAGAGLTLLLIAAALSTLWYGRVF